MPFANLDSVVKNRLLWRTLWLATTLAVTVAYVSPIFRPPGQHHADKFTHVVAFGAIAFPAYFAAKGLPGHLILTTFNLLLGVGLELRQIGIPGREFSVLDIGANGLGVLSGLTLGVGVSALLRRNQTGHRPQRRVAAFTLPGRTSSMSAWPRFDRDENAISVARHVGTRPPECL